MAEPFPLRAENAAAAVKHQPAQAVIPFAQGFRQCHRIIADRKEFMSCNIGKIGHQGGGTGINGTIGQLQRHETALLVRRDSHFVTGIDPCHRPVSHTRHHLVSLQEGFRDLRDLPVVLPHLDIHAEFPDIQLLARNLPGHSQDQLCHIRSKVRHLNELIIKISHNVSSCNVFVVVSSQFFQD